MGFVATSKTKIRNTILLLDEQPNYNSGQLSYSGTLVPSSLFYNFSLPSFTEKVDVISINIYDISGAVDDLGYFVLNNQHYRINGGGWFACPDGNFGDFDHSCYTNLWYSPFLETSVSLSSLPKENSIYFYAFSGGGQMWLILLSFKVSMSYITK